MELVVFLRHENNGKCDSNYISNFNAFLMKELNVLKVAFEFLNYLEPLLYQNKIK